MFSASNMGLHNKTSYLRIVQRFGQPVAVTGLRMKSDQSAFARLDDTMLGSNRLMVLRLRNLVNEYRKWQLTSEGSRRMWPALDQRSKETELEFTFMTYNVLAQELLEGHPQLYGHCSDLVTQWSYRAQLLGEELSDQSSDIVCLQEVNCDHYRTFFSPLMSRLGYIGIYKQRNGMKQDGCALFYKSNKFELEKLVKVDFNQRSFSPLLNRDNVAILALFKPRVAGDSNERLVVATTHLLFNPNRGDIKLAQLRLLFAEIDKLSIKDGQQRANLTDSEKYSVQRYPVIFCGDMNTEPDSPLHRFMLTGKLSPVGWRLGDLSGQREGRGRGYSFESRALQMNGVDMTCCFERSEEDDKTKNGITNSKPECEQFKKPINGSTLTHCLNLTSVYPNYDPHTNQPFVSTDHQKATALVDYIFYTSNQDSLKLLGYRRLMTSDQLASVGSLPNECLGSDHLSLAAKFVLK